MVRAYIYISLLIVATNIVALSPSTSFERPNLLPLQVVPPHIGQSLTFFPIHHILVSWVPNSEGVLFTNLLGFTSSMGPVLGP